MELQRTLSSFNKFRRRYIFVFAVIIILSAISQGVVQYFIHDQRGDSKVVNIAGRQRMLSQKLALNFNRLYSDGKINKLYKLELDSTLAELISAHDTLKFGSKKLGIDAQKDPQILQFLLALEGYISKLENLVLKTSERVPTNLEISRFNLISNQFLIRMDTTVSLIEDDLKKKGDLFKSNRNFAFYPDNFILDL